MLNTQGNTALEYLMKEGFSVSRSVEIIGKVLGKPMSEAVKLLATDLSDTQIKDFLPCINQDPPPTYVFIYGDFAHQSVAFQFTGRWDFKKAEEFRNVMRTDPKKARALINAAGKGNMVSFLWGFSGGPMFQDAEALESKRIGDTVFFQNGFSFDLRTRQLDCAKEKLPMKNRVANIFYAEGDNVREMTYDKNGVLSMLLAERDGKYYMTIVDRRLSDSMLLRLYYFKGLGTKHFTLAERSYSEQENSDYLLFKVTW
jgi:hypothetical protein